MIFRSFIALKIPLHIQTEIASLLSPIIQRYPKPLILWVKPENIHLTIRFLAERSDEELTLLASLLHKEISSLDAFSFSFSTLGTFPNSKKPRVIWIGIDAPIELIKIQGKIEEICTRIGLKRENRRFSPHITLGRINNRHPSFDISLLCEDLSRIEFYSIERVYVDEIKIFNSDLKSSGPVYTVIRTIPLGLDI